LIRHYDAVFDTVGGETYSKSFEVLKKEGGFIVFMLEQPNKDFMERFSAKSVSLFTCVNKEMLAKLGNWVDQNKIKVHVDRAFSIDDAAEARLRKRCPSEAK
jgi:alcohol dehydrogenase